MQRLRRVVVTGATLAALAAAAVPTLAQGRAIEIDDIFRLGTIRDPQVSPDGMWVAYVVSRLDRERDATDSDIWMARADGDGRDPLRLTASPANETMPRWSPDGRYLAFLSARGEDKSQVWLLDRRGGEPVKLTSDAQGVNAFTWSPDSTRLALVMTDADPAPASTVPSPIVIRRLQFKRDGEGFLSERRDHIYVFDLASRTSRQVTHGPYDDSSPVWTPDGEAIAFVSNRSENPDANENTDIFVVSAAGGEARAVAATPAAESDPAFDASGTRLAYVVGGNPKDIWYATNNIAVVELDESRMPRGRPRVLTAGVDRNVTSPRFDADAPRVLFLLEDDGHTQLAAVPEAGGAVERLTAAGDVDAYSQGGSVLVVLETQASYPPEISRLTSDGLARVTRVNDAWLATVTLSPVTRFQSTSADGTVITAYLTVPASAGSRPRPMPTLLRIHGGPVSQFSDRFEFEWQLFAAHGYAVVAANPRGSSGRGAAFSRAIWADWGNKDFLDVMGAVEHAIAQGIADPARLGVGGWSYGGILTNYVVTQTDRFKAAISGASETNYLANYGHDHYQVQWEAELGLPWREPQRWIELSPFFQVENISTPMLLMSGQDDWNVPLLNSEQLYQALRRLGRTTELVIYPGQSHGIRRPSYQKDRYERYLAWYDRFVLGR